MSESQQPPAPRRLAPGETPTDGWYWITDIYGGRVICSVLDGRASVYHDGRAYETNWATFTDFYGPLIDPR